ncbi:cobalamin biosynthesis protein CobQ [Epibacterium sp. SM1979]|uniref:Cobalamin biosynthesis protein CobQ n=1 Tax=Tritonibacter litoralis TaxID=2662264 RepID=A0A843YF52_9RHOB|nr:cobalamin biosynthesis protein CobQ [Tritonibacter litoralis]MQQ07903.1 cobalamin biosynthesis protein CobQ [Tritonibacter litoralis]
MNTPAHLLTGAALFGRKGDNVILGAAVLGSLLPDLSLYLMTAWAIYVQGLSVNVVFDELYFSPSWQQVFAIDNSIPLWGLALGVAIWAKRGWAIALCAAALLHIGLDFTMHAGDGRPNFWPFSDWVFHSPISYWDRRHHAHLVEPVALAASLVCFAVLWRGRGWVARAGFTLLALMELGTSSVMYLIFAG